MKNISRLCNMAEYFHILLTNQPNRSEVYPTFLSLSEDNGLEKYIKWILKKIGSDDIEADWNRVSRVSTPDTFLSVAMYLYSKYKIGHLRAIKTTAVKMSRFYHNILTISNKKYRLKMLHMIRSAIKSSIIFAISDKNNVLHGAYDQIYSKALQSSYRLYHSDLDTMVGENNWEMRMISGVVGLHKSSRHDFTSNELKITHRTDDLLVITSSKEPVETTTYFRKLIQFKIKSVKLSHVLLYAPMLTSLFDDYDAYKRITE